MSTQIELAGVLVDVVKKDIKNVHLSVYPPNGRIRISAPLRMKSDLIRVYAISRLGWIRKQQRKFRGQDRETPREYLNRESHYVWGKRYLLKVVEAEAPPTVELKPRSMVLRVRPGAERERKEAVLQQWYRDQLKRAVPRLIRKWEPLIGVEVERFFVQHMKTKWGSCNPATGSIRLNTELAKKPKPCLEYILVHEMVHLLEPTHNARFVALMDRFMPKWKLHRENLNRLPVRHESWQY